MAGRKIAAKKTVRQFQGASVSVANVPDIEPTWADRATASAADNLADLNAQTGAEPTVPAEPKRRRAGSSAAFL